MLNGMEFQTVWSSIAKGFSLYDRQPCWWTGQPCSAGRNANLEGKLSGGNCSGIVGGMSVRKVQGNILLRMQNYKSLRSAVICAIMV